MGLSHRKESLDTLPNEILFLIVSYCGEHDGMPRRNRPTHILSRVNRRLRRFVLPYVYSELTAPFAKKLWDIQSFLVALGDGHPCLTYVRSIRVGRGPLDFTTKYTHVESWTAVSMKDVPPLPNLRKFECLDCVSTPDTISFLSRHRSLKTLCLAWRSINRRFPNIGECPSLETLRLYIAESESTTYKFRCKYSLSANLKFTRANLTTLSIDHANRWFDNVMNAIHLPNLQALNVEDTSCRPRDVYWFIGKHHTLKEVSIAFIRRRPVLLEPLMTLIEGRGNWRSDEINGLLDDELEEQGTDENEGWEDFDNPTVLETDGPEEQWWTLAVNGFGFTRVPNRPPPTSPDKPYDGEASYKAKEVALHLHDKQPELGEEPFHSITNLGLTPPFHELEYLCLASSCGHRESFAAFMHRIAMDLQWWPCIRKFAFSCPTRNIWGNVAVPWQPEDPTLDYALAYLDGVEPPVHPCGRSITVGDFTNGRLPWPDKRHDINGLKNQIRSLLGDVAVDDMDDDLIELMPAWEARHEHKVSRAMRYLATRTSLEELEWYPAGPKGPLWSWRFIRVTSEYDPRDERLWSIVGELRWKDCLKGDPWPQKVIVGQELAHFRRRRV